MIKRLILFVLIVVGGALLAAAAHSSTRDIVPFSGFEPGTIVVKTSERRLYFVLDPGHAMRFQVGVGRKGMAWTGREKIEGKYVLPAWTPPPEIWGNRAGPRPVYPGGSPHNPMGAAALTMRGGDYAIHGTNNPASIGGFVSHGCIRMYNEDIRTLYGMVAVGTPVVVER